MSRGLTVQRTHIEISSPEVGVQFDAHWLPLTGMTYDPRHDVLDIAIEQQGHLILCPHELYVEISARGLECLCVLESVSVWQVILLRAPLVLPPSPHGVHQEYEHQCALRGSTPPTRASGESYVAGRVPSSGRASHDRALKERELGRQHAHGRTKQ